MAHRTGTPQCTAAMAAALLVFSWLSKQQLFAAPHWSEQMWNTDVIHGGSHGMLVSNPGLRPAAEDSQAEPPRRWALVTVGGAVLVGAAVGLSRRSMSLAAQESKKQLRGMTAPENADAVREDRKKGSKAVRGQRAQKLFSRRNRRFWDFTVWPRTYWMRQWENKDFGYAALFSIIHLGACFAPFYFTWKAFASFLIMYVITGMLGITLSYHRQLAHLSFKSPKWVEYFLAYCGVLAMQSHPINWVSSHRHHHGATDTSNDVHSPKDGFWWSHAGWLLDQKGTWMRVDKSNADDLSKQWYYRFLAKTYPLHAIVLPIAALYWMGGLPCVLWGFFARVVWVWHITWAVNSVSHVWGFQDWNTGDISMNNWIIGLLAFGEGWHNNHHAFETSCRHGLKWWQIDMTWYTIKTLEFFGLANRLKYPSEGKMKKLSWDAEVAGAAVA